MKEKQEEPLEEDQQEVPNEPNLNFEIQLFIQMKLFFFLLLPKGIFCVQSLCFCIP